MLTGTAKQAYGGSRRSRKLFNRSEIKPNMELEKGEANTDLTGNPEAIPTEGETKLWFSREAQDLWFRFQLQVHRQLSSYQADEMIGTRP